MRLRREPDIEIVGEAKDSIEAIKLAAQYKPRMVLIEPLMRDNLGVFAIKQIIAQAPSTAVVALTTVADTLLRMTLREAGVRYVFEKSIESQQLVERMRATARQTEAQME